MKWLRRGAPSAPPSSLSHLRALAVGGLFLAASALLTVAVLTASTRGQSAGMQQHRWKEMGTWTGRRVGGPHLDSDRDGLPDMFEMRLGTDLFGRDTDGDGFGDGLEWTAGTPY